MQLTFVSFQITQTAEETVDSKHTFETFAASQGVTVKSDHADNGTFNTRIFKESIITVKQRIDFCGAYAHHQNSIVERMIQTITFHAHCQLFHAMASWPNAITADFWPFPVRLVVDIHNNSPLKNDLMFPRSFMSFKTMTSVALTRLIFLCGWHSLTIFSRRQNLSLQTNMICLIFLTHPRHRMMRLTPWRLHCLPQRELCCPWWRFLLPQREALPYPLPLLLLSEREETLPKARHQLKRLRQEEEGRS